jgi:uncharacterized protein YkwD
MGEGRFRPFLFVEAVMIRSFVILSFLAAGAALPGFSPEEKKDDPPKLKLSDEEKTLMDLVNAERAKEKLEALTPNPVLFRVARAHSANMARKGEMKHELDGKTPAQRVDDAGYDYRHMGENIAMSDGEVALEKIVQGWMDSKGHRENILDPRNVETGLGVARNDKGEIYFTQVFGQPRKKD